MRKLAIALALASTAIAGPALARDKSWYIGVEGGAQIVEDIDYKLTTSRAQVFKVDSDTGFDVDGIIGYDFGMFRLEAEVGYKRAKSKGYNVTTPVVIGARTVNGNNTANIAGHTSALSFMVNGMFDFGEDTGVSGFVGGGVGVARVVASNYAAPGTAFGNAQTVTFIEDSDTGFAYQAIAGIRFPVSDNVDLGLKYRFFNVDNVDTIGRNATPYRARYRSHSLLASLVYNFGSPEAPPPPPVVAPPPPPPEPTPPPPPPPVCTPGPFIVFFEWDKSDVTPEAASILDGAVANYANCGTAQVELRGYADTSGTPKYNIGLSQRRADAVSAYMQSKGITGGVITTKALGETNLRVETADGVRELQNRRVEIMYGAGAGM
jgi:OmpA-OmpF porin, OOP family